MRDITDRIGEEMATGRATTADERETGQSARGISQRGITSRELGQAYRQSTRNSNNSIICMTTNAQSLILKKDDLREKVRLHKPLIIGITETWAGEGMDDGVFKLDSGNNKEKKYVMYRGDRLAGRGGGTILYISTQLGQRECLALKRPTNQVPFDSSVWCWVTPTKGKKILVGCIYRSTSSLGPNNDRLMNLLKLANDIAGENRLLILGDFNVPYIDWKNNFILPGARKLDRDFFEIVSDNFLWQHVKKATRFRGNQRSVLDLVFTKEEEDVRNVRVLSPLGRSDHGSVIWEFISKWKSKVVPKRTPVYFRGKYDIIANEIRHTRWGDIYSGRTIEEVILHYNSIYKKWVSENVPLGSPKDYNEPWMNRHIMKIWKRKNNAWIRLGERNSRNRWRVYRKYRDLLRKEMRKARRSYEKNIALNSRHNKRGFFKYVNSRLTVRPEITAMKTTENNIVEDDKDIAETMVSYFSTVHTNYRGEEMPEMQMMMDRQIGDIDITPELVEKIFTKLNVNKSCGPITGR